MERETEREEAPWRLAKCFHEAMERLDPSDIDWASLSEAERNVFYFSIKSVLSEYRDVLRVIEVDHIERRPAQAGEQDASADPCPARRPPVRT